MSVWDAVVGQPEVVAQLRRAVADASGGPRPAAAGEAEQPGTGAMTHAWLITGPPGSGRSTAAVAFATALLCPDGGCGECKSCRDVASGVHSDVVVVRPTGVIMGVEQTRSLTSRIIVLPARSDWNVIVIEDADRLNEHADNALLKSLEEPPPRGVWILCAPSADDVLPTIRSRCRVVRLRTPQPAEVAAHLVAADGVEPAVAAFAARASQGHIGRARALALDAEARAQHQDQLRLPRRLGTVAACLSAAADTVAAARARVDVAAAPVEARESAELLLAYGEGGTGAGSARARASAAMKELERDHRNRRRRMLRDELDRTLVDLLGLYRDVLAAQTGSRVGLINEEMRLEIEAMADAAAPDGTIARLDAISHARDSLAADGSEDLVFAELALELHRPGIRRS